MKYYKGVCKKDKPYNGGKFVDENGYGHKEFNFFPRIIKNNDIFGEKEYCFGFVETKSTSQNRSNELHIEKIRECERFKKEDKVDDILVVWCATSNLNETTVVGWYRNA